MQYALITKHKNPYIIILADTVEELDEAIETFYQNRKGVSPKGTDFKKSDLMKKYLRVEITINELRTI